LRCFTFQTQLCYKFGRDHISHMCWRKAAPLYPLTEKNQAAGRPLHYRTTNLHYQLTIPLFWYESLYDDRFSRGNL
jgi:hypothetical protein